MSELLIRPSAIINFQGLFTMETREEIVAMCKQVDDDEDFIVVTAFTFEAGNARHSMRASETRQISEITPQLWAQEVRRAYEALARETASPEMRDHYLGLAGRPERWAEPS